MLSAGVPLAVVSRRLGHSSIAITGDTYSHLLTGVGRDGAQRAADLIPCPIRRVPTNDSGLPPEEVKGQVRGCAARDLNPEPAD